MKILVLVSALLLMGGCENDGKAGAKVPPRSLPCGFVAPSSGADIRTFEQSVFSHWEYMRAEIRASDLEGFLSSGRFSLTEKSSLGPEYMAMQVSVDWWNLRELSSPTFLSNDGYRMGQESGREWSQECDVAYERKGDSAIVYATYSEEQIQ